METKKTPYFLMFSIILVACCLRAPITCVGPLVSMIREDLMIDNSTAGLLTTIPLVTFGATSILAGKLGSKIGVSRTILYGILILLAGILGRSFLGTPGLFIGTVVIGFGITTGNVLVPVIIKSDVPAHASIMTSIYTAGMSLFSSIASAICVPIALVIGWRSTLAMWAVLGLITLICWILSHASAGFSGNQAKGGTPEPAGTSTNMSRIALAWVIAIYMGLQSLLFYSFAAWFATIVKSQGYSVQTAGYFNSAYMIICIVGSFMIPMMIKGKEDVSRMGLILGITYTIGMGSMFLCSNPVFLIIALVLCGFCSGGCLSYSVSLFTIHTKTTANASALSGFAQSIGYLIAATGPFFSGKLYDITQNWNYPIIFLCIVAVSLIFLGYIVGRRAIIH